MQLISFLFLIFVWCCCCSLDVPYNPLNALDWENVDLFSQIADKFVDASNNINNIVGFEVRSLDASNNNPLGFGASNSEAQRCIDAVYDDGFNSLTGTTRMNPREISNVLSKQIPERSSDFVNDRHLTQFAWQWGQFIDHDVTLISEARDTLDHSLDSGDISIYVPCNDPQFDVTGSCDADEFIELFRTLQFPGTGSGSGDNAVRQQRNEITSFIDASMIYGSDDSRAQALRSFENGKLSVSEDNYLIRNNERLHNEPNDEIRFFVAGDVRPNEQLGLLTMHTIWVRFHNVIAEEVATSIANSISIDDDNFDEIVYQYSKLIVTAIVQKITYRDWLPTLFGQTAIARFLGDYSEYDSSINPAVCLIFSSAAYRLGHTLLPNFLPLRNEDCTFWEGFDEGLCPVCDLELGGIELRNTFFVPEIAADNNGFFEALLNGFSCTLANEIDVSITEGVRNFLFESALNEQGERIFGNLDLIAINLQRGREHGLPDFNSVRQHLGLTPHSDFDDMTSDPQLQQNFETIYGDINDIDLFLGLLAEDHFDDGSFGETISALVLEQFGRLRDGDRFWYQNYLKPGELLDFINCITLKSVIELTTDIDNIDSIDSIRHNIFQNQRAISIFAGVETFEAKAIPQNNIYNPSGYTYTNTNTNTPYIIQLTNIQILLLFAAIITVIACSCYTLHQCKKNKINKYRPVKYDTETDTEASDREKLQS